MRVLIALTTATWTLRSFIAASDTREHRWSLVGALGYLFTASMAMRSSNSHSMVAGSHPDVPQRRRWGKQLL